MISNPPSLEEYHNQDAEDENDIDFQTHSTEQRETCRDTVSQAGSQQSDGHKGGKLLLHFEEKWTKAVAKWTLG